MKSRAGTRRWSVYAPLNCLKAYAGGESQERRSRSSRLLTMSAAYAIRLPFDGWAYATSVAASVKYFIQRYRLEPHSFPDTYRSLAQTSIRADFPSGNVPTTLVLRRISRFMRSMTLLVRILSQCCDGKSM